MQLVCGLLYGSDEVKLYSNVAIPGRQDSIVLKFESAFIKF